MSMFRKKDEGFTLVELMVVVLIIGILVAIAIPVFNSARANAERRSCFANQRTIEGAAQTFNASLERLPATVLELTTIINDADGNPVGPFVKDLPSCPSGGTAYAFTAAADGTLAACDGGPVGALHGHF